MLTGSWRLTRNNRRSSCTNCAIAWPSTASRPARAACRASLPAIASPAKRGGARSRAAARGRESRPRGLVRGPARPRPGQARLPRRNGHRHQHGPDLRPGATWRAVPDRGAARALQDHHRHRRPAHQWAGCHGAVRQCHERQALQGLYHRHHGPGAEARHIVILDNLPAHKVAGVREAIEAVGARLLYLPSYSPEPKDRAATSIRSSKPSPS